MGWQVMEVLLTQAAADRMISHMQTRIAKLEMATENTRDRLTKIAVQLDAFATKEDLHKELHAMTWKIPGGCTLLVAAVYFIARHIG
jgi:hypothetical protein